MLYPCKLTPTSPTDHYAINSAGLLPEYEPCGTKMHSHIQVPAEYSCEQLLPLPLSLVLCNLPLAYPHGEILK